MDGLINILKTNAKTDEVINLDDNIYLYHGIYILNYIP